MSLTSTGMITTLTDVIDNSSVKVNDKKYIIPKLPTDIFLDNTLIKDHSIQRSYVNRLRKMKTIFEKGTEPQHEVHLINVTKKFSGNYQGETIEVSKGFYCADGHSRRLYWQQKVKKSEIVPEDLVAIVYEVDNWQDYRDIYYSFDSSDATEKKNEKITGAIRALGISVASTRATGGNFASAIDIAYPGDNKDDVITKVAYFKDEIEALDTIGLFKTKDKGMTFQAMMAIGLVALKVFDAPPQQKARIIGGLTQIANAQSNRLDNNSDKWYGIDAILYEYLSGPVNKNNPVIPVGEHRKTSFASIPPQMDFMWYCIELYMTKNTVSKNGGFKGNHIKGAWSKAQSSMIAKYPPQGYVSDIDEDDEE